MNKLFFILVSLILFSCSSSEDSGDSQTTTCINPPTWLHGTWVEYDTSEPDVIVGKFIISENNIISFDYSNSTDWKSIYCNKEPAIATSEAFENTYYKFTWTTSYSGISTTINGYFIKQPESNKMMYNNYLDDEGIVYTKL